MRLPWDEKKSKGVSPTNKDNSELYILNVWVDENSICISQQKVDDKSNEIMAIPKILDSLDIEGATVSIDAIGTQTNIAEQIRGNMDIIFCLSKAISRNFLRIFNTPLELTVVIIFRKIVTGSWLYIETGVAYYLLKIFCWKKICRHGEI